MSRDKPDIPSWLLWEFEYETFNYNKSAKIVIERVLKRGNLYNWKEIVRYYSHEQIISTINWSAQLTEREKDFAIFFLNSDLLHAA